jgi:hypothetical protein
LVYGAALVLVTGAHTRKGTLTEVDLTHWPESLRWLAMENDPRLPPAHQLVCK